MPSPWPAAAEASTLAEPRPVVEAVALGVRLEVTDTMSEHVLELLLRELEGDPGDVITVPGLLDLTALWALHAVDRPDLKDDPFVPAASFRDPAIAANPHVTLVVTKHGGHCGFLGDPDGAGDDGYWAENQIVEFIERQATLKGCPTINS